VGQSTISRRTVHRPVQNWIRRLSQEEPPRSKSLIITIFGDSIKPRARGLWLSQLIAMLRPFHMDERLARTSTFRLAEEGWLASERVGRKSRYSLTDSGVHRIETAHRRIYDPPPHQWPGVWTIVILSRAGNRVAERAELRRELEWEGFGTLGPGIAVHPCADREALAAVLERLGLTGSAIVLEARDLSGFSALESRALIAECWNLEGLAQMYAAVIARFEPLVRMLDEPNDSSSDGTKIDAETAFVLQTLLIHSWRRAVLHDPRFPSDLLPQSWPGSAAYDLCRRLYIRLFEQAGEFIARHLDEDESRIRGRDFFARFGGLPRP
jgi:phenylacetic acid degradation operon negative regulatory protein